jgi:plasmid stability protein
MASLTVRNIPVETLRAIRIAAARKGRSMEAEVRTMLGEIYREAKAIPAEEAQRRLAALMPAKPEGRSMTDEFIAHRREDSGE